MGFDSTYGEDPLETVLSASAVITLAPEHDNATTTGPNGVNGSTPLNLPPTPSKVLAVLSLLDKKHMANSHYAAMIVDSYEKAVEIELHRLRRSTTPPDAVVCIISGSESEISAEMRVSSELNHHFNCNCGAFSRCLNLRLLHCLIYCLSKIQILKHVYLNSASIIFDLRCMPRSTLFASLAYSICAYSICIHTHMHVYCTLTRTAPFEPCAFPARINNNTHCHARARARTTFL